jgi:hypothetical protein
VIELDHEKRYRYKLFQRKAGGGVGLGREKTFAPQTLTKILTKIKTNLKILKK